MRVCVFSISLFVCVYVCVQVYGLRFFVFFLVAVLGDVAMSGGAQTYIDMVRLDLHFLHFVNEQIETQRLKIEHSAQNLNTFTAYY